ncbi:hypothetical protein [Hanstruepera ponticola]|uniref:hypothetical protein n=1 Tax=Hanstruepera ponticola TaxID=2042995 RepID=UPI001785E511|nr:hypothetical protein [Hanstruepera ponticola]
MVSIKKVLGLLIIVSMSCANDNKQENVTKNSESKIVKEKYIENLNISLLLDLSDRINPEKYPNESMEYFMRDVAYIRSVSEAFDLHLRTKKVREMNDRIQLYFDPEPNNQNINTISKNLKYHVDRNNVSLELLDEVKSSYAEKPLEIYNLAIKDNEYIGSDTWRFFKTKVNDYCIESGFRNILVILTDGYIYHKDSKIKESNLTTYLTPQDIRRWKLDSDTWLNKINEEKFGFIPATENLAELEILVLGINPDKKNPYEEEIINKYWKDWFNSMGVKRYEIKTAELPSNMDELIKDFILNY